MLLQFFLSYTAQGSVNHSISPDTIYDSIMERRFTFIQSRNLAHHRAESLLLYELHEFCAYAFSFMNRSLSNILHYWTTVLTIIHKTVLVHITCHVVTLKLWFPHVLGALALHRLYFILCLHMPHGRPKSLLGVPLDLVKAQSPPYPYGTLLKQKIPEGTVPKPTHKFIPVLFRNRIE